MFVTVNEPASFVVALRSAPVASFLTVTVAFGMVAPVGSFTKPVIVPKSDWANRARHASANKSAALMNHLFCMRFSPRCARRDVGKDPRRFVDGVHDIDVHELSVQT